MAPSPANRDGQMTIALECEGLDVSFGSVHALQDINLAFASGQVHVLLGQNGAGKSTLARYFSGLVDPGRGRMKVLGQTVANAAPDRSRQAGLDIVHQRFSLPPGFTVAEALEFASAAKMGSWLYRGSRIRQRWSAALQEAGIALDPRQKIADLPVETLQSLEIVRALANNARVLILDEPTALLSPAAIAALFDKVRALRARGVTLIMILHKLDEVMQIADTVSVLRGGRLVLPPTPVGHVDAGGLSDLMIGEAHGGPQGEIGVRGLPAGAMVAPMLRLETISCAANGADPALSGLSCTMNPGEIVGVAGVEGNGQRALAEVICGIAPLRSGRIVLDGKDITESSPFHRRTAGIRAVPFDRMTEGSSLTSPLWENLMTWQSSSYRQGRWPTVSIAAIRRRASDLLRGFGVVFRSLDQTAGTLSGGNLQRLILAREFSGTVKVVIAAQPTRGLDFRATEFVWSELRRLRAEGAAILLISSDLDEIMGIADRVIVMRGGAIANTFAFPFDQRALGDSMVGAVR